MVKVAKKKKADPTAEANPEGLESNPYNSLFGRKRGAEAEDDTALSGGAAAAVAPAPKKKRQLQVSKLDPAVSLRAAEKRRKREQTGESARGAQAGTTGKASKAAPAAGKAAGGPRKAVRPHADLVDQTNRIWEKLRQDKTPAAERSKLIDEVLQLFDGKVSEVLQKHDAARVLQSCFKHGSTAQRDALLKQLKGGVAALARSHYGHFLLLSVVRHGSAAHRQLVLDELLGHVAELMVHAEGSAVVQLAYAEVATAEQRHAMFREMWGRETLLFDTQCSYTCLAELFAADPLCKPRVLRRLEVTLSKAARKGLAVTPLVQRGAAELLEHGEPSQKAELVASFREAAVHGMHTRDGARVACGCLAYGDAKERKAILKGMKGYVARAALDPHGALVLCVALEVVDDTVLLSKGVLAELIASLPELATHAHGCLPLLSLLAPRSSRHFTAEQLAIMGDQSRAISKKDPATRRDELLNASIAPLLASCEAHASAFAISPHGAALLFEAARAAAEPAGAGGASRADDSALLGALASAALNPTESAEAEDSEDGKLTLLTHHHSGRLYKRLVQAREAFALALLPQLRGKLAKLAKRGAGWVVLALLESPATSEAVTAELRGAAASLQKTDANGCKSLRAALLKLG